MVGIDLIVQVYSVRILRRGDRKRGQIRSVIVREPRFARQQRRRQPRLFRRVRVERREAEARVRRRNVVDVAQNRRRKRRIRRPVRHAGSDQRVERRLILKARVQTSNLVVHETQRKYEALCE